jgi:hypothetical protein
MRIVNRRVAHNNDSSLGVLSIDGELKGFVIEDEPREFKVIGETRIPAGIYKVDFKYGVTPLTKEYREKFEWFTHHLEIKDVPNFSSVYIHIGNFEGDTDACQLVNRKAKIHEGNFAGEDSTSFFKEFYEIVSEALLQSDEVLYEIIDDTL